MFEQASLHCPGPPLFLYGHSLGGIQALHYGLLRKLNVKGVVAIGSGLHNAIENQVLKVMAAKILGMLTPKTANPSGLDATAISRNQAVVDV